MGSFQIVTSYSEIKDFRTCLQKHHFKYKQGLKPRKKDRRLALGDVVHVLLEAHSKGQPWKPKLKKMAKKYASHKFIEELEYDLIGDAERIMKGYLRRWKQEPLDYVLVEERIGPIELTPEVGIVAKIDGLAQDQNGKFWLIERKTRNKFRDPGFLIKDLQSAIYCWMLREMDFEVAGVLWDEVRTKVPSEPHVLKSGGLSVAKKIDTDYYTYRKAIDREGLDPNSYTEILDRLKTDKKNSFYRRQPLPVNDRMIELIVREARKTAKVMAKTKRPVMELGFMCNFCEFEKLCEARLMNLDTKFMIKSEFTRRNREKK